MSHLILDFVDCVGNKCTAGVAAFVSVTVKSFDIHRENVGYATALGPNKGSAIHRARKVMTFKSFGHWIYV